MLNGFNKSFFSVRLALLRNMVLHFVSVKRLVRQILRIDLWFYPYKLVIVQKLQLGDYALEIEALINQNENLNHVSKLMIEIHNDLSCMVLVRWGGRSHSQSINKRSSLYLSWVPLFLLFRFNDVYWPLRFPDLSICKSYLWGHLKPRIYEKKPRT